MTINCYTLPNLCKQLVCLRRQQNHDDISSGCNGKQKALRSVRIKKKLLTLAVGKRNGKFNFFFESFKDFIR